MISISWFPMSETSQSQRVVMNWILSHKKYAPNNTRQMLKKQSIRAAGRWHVCGLWPWHQCKEKGQQDSIRTGWAILSAKAQCGCTSSIQLKQQHTHFINWSQSPHNWPAAWCIHLQLFALETSSSHTKPLWTRLPACLPACLALRTTWTESRSMLSENNLTLMRGRVSGLGGAELLLPLLLQERGVWEEGVSADKLACEELAVLGRLSPRPVSSSSAALEPTSCFRARCVASFITGLSSVTLTFSSLGHIWKELRMSTLECETMSNGKNNKGYAIFFNEC